MSGELVALDRARSITQEIRDHLKVSWGLIAHAYEIRIWEPLGYDSWDAYLAGEFGAAPLRVPREQRPEIVSSLRQHGLSTRAIAGAMGIDQSTVSRTPTDADASVDPPARVQSLDGRSRPATQPLRPRPEPTPALTDKLAARRPEPEPAPTPVPMPPTDDQLLDAIERRTPGARAEVEQKRLRARWSAAVASAADIGLLDAENLAAAIDPTVLDVGVTTLRRSLQLAETALERQQSPGLRVVGGVQ